MESRGGNRKWLGQDVRLICGGKRRASLQWLQNRADAILSHRWSRDDVTFTIQRLGL